MTVRPRPAVPPAFASLCLGVLLLGAGMCAPPPPPAPSFDLDEVSIAGLRYRLETGQETARSLVEKYLARIEAVDRLGPGLRSVIEINPDALAIADARDAERAAGKARGLLHGIPVLIKDNIATADRMSTTAGSLALEGVRPAADAFVVTKLREAGAVILGKTNLSEWANFRSLASTSGWSARGGQTRNPYALDRNPSGSSSGSAAAIAANLAAVSVGTETDGSIVSPASANGLVGIKPTVGLISRTGIIPISRSQDTAGPMARTVADAVTLLDVLFGVDDEDQATRGAAGRRPRDGYRSFLDPEGLKGARLGVLRSPFTVPPPGAQALLDAALDVLRTHGATIVDPVEAPLPPDLHMVEMEVLLYEFKADLDRYLAALGPQAPVRSLPDLIAFNVRHAEREMPLFGQDLLLLADRKGPLTEAAYLAARDKSRRLAGPLGIDALLARHQVDALVALTSGPAWLTDPVNGDAPGFSSSTLPAVAGYPHVTVPAGQVAGLPVGLSFMAGAWSEGTLIRLAYAYEQATRHRRPPAFPASAGR